MTRPPSAKPRGAPIAAQVVALLVAVVAVGQLLTLAIAVLVPPPRPAVYRISEIASALEGQTVRARDGRRLLRTVSAAAPLPLYPHPGLREGERRELAQHLGVPDERVRLEESPPEPHIWGAVVWREHRGPPSSPGPADGPPGRRPPDDPGPPDLDEGFDHGRPGAGQFIAAPKQPPGASAKAGRGPEPFPNDGRPGARLWLGLDRHRLVFGEFTAALQQPSGAWTVVKPEPEPFPNAWQQRVGLWFIACLIVLGPVGYLFARRLVAPIGAFARAAERLGRDPSAPPLALTGPPEIEKAARAFNTMQVRLQRYIADRTTMMAAISHDLRTPLARVRFKMEQAPATLRSSVGGDLDEMEAMITAVLGFIRDVARPRERIAVDLLSIVECVVDDAVAAGGSAELETAEPIVVEADDTALKRLFANLVDNAIKYGGHADVRLGVEDAVAVVEIADRGPGLPAGELERVFEPFYRAEPSRNRATGGVGLGLAVARSIARAHGGDVVLRASEAGLTAVVRLPLAPGRRR
jgi:two-component system OmpR family sensor kinase